MRAGTLAAGVVAAAMLLPSSAHGASASHADLVFGLSPGGRTVDTITLRASCVPTDPDHCAADSYDVSLAIDNPIYRIVSTTCPARLVGHPFGPEPEDCDVTIGYFGPIPAGGAAPQGLLTTGTVSSSATGTSPGPAVRLHAWKNNVTFGPGQRARGCKAKKSKRARQRCAAKKKAKRN